jgi:hypothetical protein
MSPFITSDHHIARSTIGMIKDQVDVLRTQQSRPEPNSLRDVLVAVIVSSVLSILTVNRFAPQFLNADTILHAIMSLQNVTLFYWGQNRFLNLFPWLLSWISDAPANLCAQLFLFSFSFFALLCCLGLVGAQIVFPEALRRDRWMATVLLLTITFALAKPAAMYDFTGQGQPYATSFLLAVVAILVVLARPLHPLHAVTAAICLLTAIGLNPSVLILTLITSGFMVGLADRRGAIFIAGTMVIGLVGWSALSRFAPAYPIPYVGLTVDNLSAALVASVTSMAWVIRLPVLAAFCALIVVLIWSRLSSASNLRVYLVMISLLVFALVWWIGFSANTWVKQNGYHFRYFFPVLIIGCVAITLQVFCYLLPQSKRIKDFCAVGCVALILTYLVREPVAFSDYSIFAQVQPLVSYAQSNGLRFIAGDYWVVWPTVFRLLDRRESAFGLTARASGNARKMRQALDRGILAEGSGKALCLGSDEKQCAKDAEALTGRRWTVTIDRCGGACSVIETSKRSDR